MEPQTELTTPAESRERLVAQLKDGGALHDAAVEEAFLTVPRHLFVPDVDMATAYKNGVVILKEHGGIATASASQPSIMAIMLEQLDLRPGQRVLEIGAGSGYNAALMAHMVGPQGKVTTLDIEADLVEKAAARFASAGYANAGAITGDGGTGYPPTAPFDRIIATMSVWDIPPAWVQQLAPDGRMVVPVWVCSHNLSLALEKADGSLIARSAIGCGFMRMRGAFAGPEDGLRLALPEAALLAVNDRRGVDIAAVSRAIEAGGRQRPTGIRLRGPGELAPWLEQWLGVQEPRYCSIQRDRGHEGRSLLPAMRVQGDLQICLVDPIGMVEGSTLCLLAPPPDQMPGHGEEAFDLQMWAFGPDEKLPDYLLERLKAWDATGRPRLHLWDSRSMEGRIRVYPMQTPYTPNLDRFVSERHWHRYVFHRPPE